MKLSIVIPAHNEEGSIAATVTGLWEACEAAGIPHEVLVVDDHSTDNTVPTLRSLQHKVSTLRYVVNHRANGFGRAIQTGFENVDGEVVAICMGDASDLPLDVVHFYRVLLIEGVDCVFGTRFSPESEVSNYPKFKLFLNRIVNTCIRFLFNIQYNDVTNAFKMYRTETLEGLKPFLSPHFNLTVELPLKAIVRGYRYKVVPNSWIGRSSGESKLKIKEMGSRYLFIVLYCLIEKWFSRGDYRVADLASKTHAEI